MVFGLVSAELTCLLTVGLNGANSNKCAILVQRGRGLNFKWEVIFTQLGWMNSHLVYHITTTILGRLAYGETRKYPCNQHTDLLSNYKDK